MGVSFFGSTRGPRLDTRQKDTGYIGAYEASMARIDRQAGSRERR